MLKLKMGDLAQDDLVNQMKYYAEVSGSQLAERFLQAIRSDCGFLSQFPSSGSCYDSHLLKLRAIRYWPVRDFPRHVIFYRLDGATLTVLRVLHGSRRISSLLIAALN